MGCHSQTNCKPCVDCSSLFSHPSNPQVIQWTRYRPGSLGSTSNFVTGLRCKPRASYFGLDNPTSWPGRIVVLQPQEQHRDWIVSKSQFDPHFPFSAGSLLLSSGKVGGKPGLHSLSTTCMRGEVTAPWQLLHASYTPFLSCVNMQQGSQSGS